MPVVLEDTSAAIPQPGELFPIGDDRAKTWSSDEDIRDGIPVNSTSRAGPAGPAFATLSPSLAAVSIDSAQHLLQSISSDDDGSRSPSPVRRSSGPVVEPSFPSPVKDPMPEGHADISMPDALLPVTMEEICNCEESEIVSLVANLDVHDRHPFISHAIRRFSHEVMLSLRNDSKFVSDIESWCRDAFDDQDVVFVEDILLLIELLPVSDVSSVASLSQFLSQSRIFADTQYDPRVQRILKKWGSLCLNKNDQNPTGAKSVLSASLENASQSVKPPSSAASSRPSRPPPIPKSGFHNRRNSPYSQPSNANRRPSPARAAPGYSTQRRDPTSERSTAPTRSQRSPRSPSPRGGGAARSKPVSGVGADRRSSNAGHFTRDSSSTARNARPFDSANSYPSRTGYEYDPSRSSAHQRQSQHERAPAFKDEYRDRRVSEPHRFGSTPESRSRDIDMLPSSAPSSNRQPYSSRDPTRYGMQHVDGYPEKVYYSDSDNRTSNGSRSAPPPVSSSVGTRSGNVDYKPRESGPGSFRSGTQSKLSYDESYPRSSQSQFHSSSVNDRSVSPHTAHSRPPHSYRSDERSHHDDERTHFQDGSRDFNRYRSEANPKHNVSKDYQHATVRGVKPQPRDDYRDPRRDDEKDLRQSAARDYRRDLTKDSRPEPQSFKLNDSASDYYQPNAKRKPDLKWSQDGPSKTMRLSDEERRELVQKGACLYCRKPGHTIENCRTRPARSS